MDLPYDDETFFNQYKQLRSSPLSYNEVVEMPEMKRALPHLENKTILDIGCGLGHLIAHMLTHSPKAVTGTDASNLMINHCTSHFDQEDATFLHGEFTEMEWTAQFDVITASLVFHYIEDFDQLCRKLATILKPGGTLLFTMEHPITTACKTPHIKIEGVPHKVDHYFEEGERSAYWSGMETYVEKYHHTIETLFNSLIQNGLSIDYVKDLGQSPEVFELYSEERIEKLRHFPPFILIRCKRID
ncbi:class I SAM-dependent methyltransferase [Salinicoccus hispanicus]|uniref:Methyltransferase domain-containing protein n=1 Tax=Salinicoccus hispanicus TaxID=157225 RepID=A0A6N8TZN2_9STAP|nr:class I SAM-dependent methyltransferase [Salinicoccus hispanicus]MXQ51284.1 methyltransferase domain-containing protein [Salinicoccus hispanicus]